MESPFASLPFVERERAAANLEQIRSRLPASLFASLPALLEQVPDADGALNYLERYLASPSPELERALAHIHRNPAALHSVLSVFAYSRFLSETLIHQPDLVLWLHRPGGKQVLERLKSAEDLHEEFARFEATAYDQPPAVVLARFKRREYVRIMLRDVLRIAGLTETMLELSRLADVLLDRAHRACSQRLHNAFGAPQYADASGRVQPAALTILSLGKLGAEELNYSSDVDLMFLYSRDGETSGGSSGSITNAEYFVRLAQAILKLISEVTPEGAVFRVDLRLRPQGGEGDLAVSLANALEYYRQRAREWELQMLIKARPSAGEIAAGRLFLRELRPLIYRREFNLAAVEAVLNARAEMTRELLRPRGASARTDSHAAEWNVKLSPGGIRDIEFLTQCLQRLYGGTDSWLIVPSTLVGLQRLHDKGFLSGRDFQHLAAAYDFLRRVEHRLQLRDGLQRHTLPEDAHALDRLARRCGLDPADGPCGEQLLGRIQRHFQEVAEIYGRILSARAAPPGELEPQIAPSAEASEGALLHRLRREYPAVARAATDAGAMGDPFTRRGLHRFLSSAALETELMARLETHPSWVVRAGELFSRSDLLVEILSRNPMEVAVVADPGLGGFRGPMVAAEGTFAEAMAALRLAYRRGVLATVVRGLSSRSIRASEPFATFETLTRLAEEAIAGAIHLAAREVLGSIELGSSPFAVIALGRLGTYEMDIGSDADLIFVIDNDVKPEDREQWRRLVERFVHVVSSHTREGLLFPVDTRLRPRGGQGEIVQTAGALAEYFRSEAQGWEAATYLKARAVAGNPALAAAAIAGVYGVLRERYQRNEAELLARELIHTRERLEKEGTAANAKGEFKKVSGGYYDIDYLVAFLTLTRLPQPLPPSPVVKQIGALQAAHLLSAADARNLRAAATLFRAIDHAVRIITGRPAHRLPDSVLATRATDLIRQWGVSLEHDLDQSTAAAREHARALYHQVLLAAQG